MAQTKTNTNTCAAACRAAGAIDFGFVDKITEDRHSVTVYGKPVCVKRVTVRATRAFGIFPTIHRLTEYGTVRVSYFWTVDGFGTARLETVERLGKVSAKFTWSRA